MARHASWRDFGNWWVRRILRSPLHSLLSRTVMLITVTGRRTGRRYTVPANYVRDGALITAFSKTDRTWWRSLQGGAPVRVLLRGREYTGVAAVVDSATADLAAAWQAFYGRVSPRPISAAEAARTSRDRVLIRICLDDLSPPTEAAP